MPRGTLVTTLYSAEIPWLDAFKHQLRDRSLLVTLKGSFVAQPPSYGAQSIASKAFCWTSLFKKHAPRYLCLANATGAEQSPLRSVCSVAPALHRGAVGHCSRQALCRAEFTLRGQYCDAQARPTLPRLSLHCKNHRCALSKATSQG